MIRGILAGGLWGLIIGAVVIALTSQIADWRDLSPAMTARQAEAEAEPAAPAAVSEQAPSVVAAAERAPRVAGATPQVGAADEISSPMLDTRPPEAPLAGGPSAQAGVAASEVATPEAPQELETAALEPPAPAPAPAPEVDQPPRPDEPALAPASSAPAAQAEVAAPDVPDPAPAAPATQPAAAESAPLVVAEAPGTAPAAASEMPPDTPVAPEPVAEAAPVETVPDPAVAESEAEAPPVVGRSETEIAAPRSDPAPEPTAPAPEAPVVATENVTPEPVPAGDEAPRTAPVASGGQSDGEAEGAPQIIRIADGERALPGRRVSSLPQVDGGDEPEAGAAEADAEEAPAVEAGAAAETEISALDANRQPFEAPDGAGLIAVVLVQEDGTVLDLPGAGTAAVPLTLAVPAGLPNAAEVARAYRAAGYELAAIPDLPPRPRAQDVEVALPVTLDTVPGAVAVMDAGDGGFQDDRGATESVVAALVASGHGLLTWPKGFNTAQKLAEQEGVPATLVFRPLEPGDAASVARQLDQVAFRARQEGGIVLVGRADPAMIEALGTWAADTRRTDTVLAPLSAVLLGG